jgi:hypothetical protein
MSTLDELLHKQPADMDPIEYAIFFVAQELDLRESATGAINQLATMRQLLGDQLERIELQQAVVDAAGVFAVTDSPELPDDSRCAVIVSAGKIRTLAAALKALPQPVMKQERQ